MRPLDSSCGDDRGTIFVQKEIAWIKVSIIKLKESDVEQIVPHELAS